MFARLGGLGAKQLGVEAHRASLRNLVLYPRLIAGIAVEPLLPNMRVGPSINQPSIDPNMIGRGLNAPFQYIADAQLAADLLGVNRLVPVGARGAARSHAHAGELRQIDRQIVCDPVCEAL